MLKSRFVLQSVSRLALYKQVVLTALVLTIFADIHFLKESSDVRLFSLLLLYCIGIIVYKLTSKYTFTICLFLLLVMYFEFIFSGTSQQTERAAVWLFFFLGVGIVQQLKE